MPKNTRVSGHELVSEGAPFERRATSTGYVVASRLNNQGVSGQGRGLCSCKAMSDVLSSGGARKAWHRAHKAEVLASQ